MLALCPLRLARQRSRAPHIHGAPGPPPVLRVRDVSVEQQVSTRQALRGDGQTRTPPNP